MSNANELTITFFPYKKNNGSHVNINTSLTQILLEINSVILFK